MLQKIASQFTVLKSQHSRFVLLSQSFHPESNLSSSLLSALKSVTMLCNSIGCSYGDMLSKMQLDELLRVYEDVVAVIGGKFGEICEYVEGGTRNAVKEGSGGAVYCGVCGENLHQSNIKQTKILLQERSRQNFHFVMEQFKKIAEEPIFTKEENNQFQQKLHYQLSQRQKVLNMNCNRIEQFVQIMDATLADLMKIKQTQFNDNQNNSQIEFINANKISQDVSNFLQHSFSQKIPPWIHKMFTRMMTFYVQQQNEKKMQKSTQTSLCQTQQSKQMKQYIKQKKILQKENKQLTQQLKQLKICYKKLEEINNEHAITIANMPRIMKIKANQGGNGYGYGNGKEKSRRNSKNFQKDKHQKVSEKNVQVQGSQDEADDDEYNNYSILEDGVTVMKKRRKIPTGLFPQIKKSKYDTNGGKDMVNTGKSQGNQSKKQQNSGRYTHRSKENKQNESDEQQNNQNRNVSGKNIKNKSQKTINIGKDKSQKKIRKQRQNTNRSQMDNDKQNKDEIKQEIRQNGRRKQTIKKQPKKHNTVNIREKYNDDDKQKIQQKSYGRGPPIQKNKPTKLIKINKAKLEQSNTLNAQYSKSSQDSSIRQLYQYVANIKLSKSSQSQFPHISNQNQIEPSNSNQNEPQNTNPSPSYSYPSSVPSTSPQNSSRSPIQNQPEDITHNSSSKSNFNSNFNSNSNSKSNCDKTSLAIPLALSQYNKQQNVKQLEAVKKISQDLSKKIMLKKNSLYSLVGDWQAKERGRDRDANGSGNGNGRDGGKIKLDLGKGNGQDGMDYCLPSHQIKQRYYQSCAYQNNQEYINDQNNYRKSQNLYQTTQKMKQVSSVSQPISPKSFQQSKKVQKILFELLKSNNILQKQANFTLFSNLLTKMQPQPLLQPGHSVSLSVPPPPLSPEPPQAITHNSIYGRLFLSKAIAYKYQQSMTKSYHKKIIKQLSQHERNYCYQMYCRIKNVKKMGRFAYHEFCSILRYPYQTLYNNFQVVSFMGDMSLQTFQYFFRKIAWIHRKCQKTCKNGVCQHIQAVNDQLKSALAQNA